MAVHSFGSRRQSDVEAENERLRRSVGELSLLNELAVTIGATNDSEKIIHTIVRKAVRSVEAEQGDIMLITREEKDELSTLIRTRADSGSHDPYRINSSLMGWIQINKKPLLINDPAGDSRFSNTFLDPDITNILCVPLMVRSQMIGILSVYNKKSHSAQFSKDDQRLLSIIASQSAHIIENARLAEEEKALYAIREEVRLAHEIQHSLLPESAPDVPGYGIAGSTRQAHTVGGDYYDVFPLDAHHMAFCVGDASGKGLPASLFIANVQATLHGQALWSPSVNVCLDRVNQLLSQRTRKGLFATLFYGVLNTLTNTFSYSNAGHNRPFLCRADGQIEKLKLGDVMLGFKSDYTYRQEEILFSPGDTLFIFSDGLPEARNEAGAFFEEERISELLFENRHESAENIVSRVLERIDSFIGDTPVYDDMTILVVARRA